MQYAQLSKARVERGTCNSEINKAKGKDFAYTLLDTDDSGAHIVFYCETK